MEQQAEEKRYPPLMISYFRVPPHREDEATHTRAALASFIEDEKEREQFVKIPIRTHAGLCGWRMQAIAPDDSVNFVCNMKTLEIRWIDYAPIDDG